MIVECRAAGDADLPDDMEQADLEDRLLIYERTLHGSGVNTYFAHDARSILVSLWDQ